MRKRSLFSRILGYYPLATLLAILLITAGVASTGGDMPPAWSIVPALLLLAIPATVIILTILGLNDKI